MSQNTPSQKKRARDYGLQFPGEPGALNAITDVARVRVGYRTLLEGQGERAVRTGVTAIVVDPATETAGSPAGIFSFNGTGEMTGSHLIEETGALFGPVLMTGTLNVGAARDGALLWAKKTIAEPEERFSRILPVVAETFDGRLHDAWGFHLKPEHAVDALERAASGAIEEGAVGGGAGMISFGFKGGVGTASRTIAFGPKRYAIGVLAQCNFGMRQDLTILGAPVGRWINDLQPEGVELTAQDRASLIVVIATDAPFDAGGLKRLARRATIAMGRLGSAGEATSGDIFLAFSTAARIRLGGDEPNIIPAIPPASLDPFAKGAVEAVEEALVNALFAGETMRGRAGALVHGMPNERVAELVRKDAVRPHSAERT
jgi:L-aminopeptidase/D-esterase-like protein